MKDLSNEHMILLQEAYNKRSDDKQINLLQNKIDEHIKEYRAHRDNEHRKWKVLINVQKQNTQSLKDLTESTHDLIKIWEAADGTIKTMSVLGKFIGWLSGLAVIGVSITWIFDHIKALEKVN